MKKISISLLVALIVLTFVSLSSAAQIDIFGTGVNISLGEVDTHYSLIDPDGDSATAYAAGDGHSAWKNPTGTAQWITPTGDGTDKVADGLWQYSIDFDLTGYDSSTAVIEGFWASDNSSSILLNENNTGYGTPGFSSFTPFSLTSGFNAGINKLTFSVTNAPLAGSNPDNPSGLIVDIETATVVPEPSTFLLLGSGLAGLGFYARKRKKA